MPKQPPVIHNLTTEERFEYARTPPTGRHMLCMGFYPTQPMWVGRNVTPLPADVQGSPELAALKHQSIKWYGDNVDYTLFFTRDGMVVIGLSGQLLMQQGLFTDADADRRHLTGDPLFPNMGQTTFGRKWALYLDYLNAAHLLLAAARQPFLQSLGIEQQYVSEVTLSNAIVFQHYYDDPLHRTVPDHAMVNWSATDGSVRIDKHPALRCPTPAHVPRAGCPVLAAEQYDILDRVHRQLSSCDVPRVQLLARVARAVHAFQEMSYDMCFVGLWTVIENSINRLYDTLIAEAALQAAVTSPTEDKLNRKHTNLSRQIKKLREHHRLPPHRPAAALPAAAASSSTSTQSPDGRFMELLEQVRTARNRLVHGAMACNDGHCTKAYYVLWKLVMEEWQITPPKLQSRGVLNIATELPAGLKEYMQESQESKQPDGGKEQRGRKGKHKKHKKCSQTKRRRNMKR